jgi:hypothetical protein
MQEPISKMHLTPKGFVAPPMRDLTSIFMNIKVRQTDLSLGHLSARLSDHLNF